MIKFFRKIRQILITENKFSKYLLYAVGEVILVVIGILIALSINNWNEGKKLTKVEKQLFENLIASLKQDSAEIARILPHQVTSIMQQNKIINSTTSEIISSMTEEKISKMLYELYCGAYSFYPKYGAYNSVVSSKGIDIIKSVPIKSKLINLYDYEYKRYESIDKIVDDRFQNILSPFLNEKFGFYLNSDLEPNLIDKRTFENKYEELQLECRNLMAQLAPTLLLLQSIQESVNSLLHEMQKELEK